MREIRSQSAKVTIRDVASDAGVSVAAVSKVLRNAYGVSDGLRAKVLKSIEDLGYRPSTAARGMRGKTYSVGMLLVEMSNPFLPSVVEGAKKALRQAGYQMLIGVGEAQTSIERSLIDSMIDLQMDGILLIAPRLSGRLLARYAAQCPMAVIGHHEPHAAAFDTVNSDDRLGARSAVEALIARGCRNVEMISLPRVDNGCEVFELREDGYRQAMQAAGLTEHARIWRIREKPGGPGERLGSIFERDRIPDAFFCWSDIHAIEVLNEAHRRGINVPDQLSVVGYDNTPVAGMPLINLSSVEQRGEKLGQLAARALLSRLSGRKDAEHVLVEPELLLRGSVRTVIDLPQSGGSA
jgi:LacI family transcriptional regulator